MPTNLETVTIRKMTKEDLDEVTVIDSEVYGDHHWSKKSFFDELSNDLARYYSLINSDGKLVAYAGTWHILEECHITNIAVSPLHRRKKYGEVLLKQIIDDCYSEKIKYITLEVRVSNSAAINLYSKYGFTSFGTRKAYYQDNNEDALIMWTKNIFYEEYKSNYEKITQKLNEGIIVK